MLSFLGTERLNSCTAVNNEEAKKKQLQQCSHTALKVSATGNGSENNSDSKTAFGQEVCVKATKLVHISHGLFRRAGNGITNISYSEWKSYFLNDGAFSCRKDPYFPDATNDVIMPCSTVLRKARAGSNQALCVWHSTAPSAHQWIPGIISYRSKAHQTNWLLSHYLPPDPAWDSPHSTLRMV